MARVCIVSVDVRAEGQLQFNFTWTAFVEGSGYDYLIKYSDQTNHNMYITDDLGNRYDHIETGGEAGREVKIWHGQTVSGWFLFPPAQTGATSFVFHDDDQHVAFEGFVLLH